MKKTRITLSLIAMLLVCAFVLGACTGPAQPAAEEPAAPVAAAEPAAEPAEEPAAIPDETLYVVIDDEPTSLNPTYITSQVFAPVTLALFDMLITENTETGESEPNILSSWEWVDDTHLRYTIRDDVYTANGTKLIASDIIYSCKVGSEGESVSYFMKIDFEGCTVESDTTAVLAFKESFPNFIEAIQNPAYCVYSEADVAALGGVDASHKNPAMGTGKYKFVEWVDAQYIKLERNDDYWNKDDMPYYKYIVFSFNGDANARLLALQSGDVDVATNIALSQVATMGDDLTSNVRDTTDSHALYMNCSRTPFDNEKVRLAVAKLINADAICKILYAGYGSLTETPFGPASYYYKGAETPRTVDVEGAKALLAEAGYADGFEFTLTTLAFTQASAEIIQENLSQAGIKVAINPLDFGAYIPARQSGNYDAFIGTVGTADFTQTLNLFDGRLSPEQAFGGALYNDDALNALIDAAKNEKDFAARKEILGQIQDYIREHVLCIGVCSIPRSDACKTSVTGIRFHIGSFIDVSAMRPAA